ncbi:MAG: radical SAM protein [Deltaproteobacteria bacterium]|nr:radical SAM protein [Deltaproteobacteria bacterium]
MPNLSRMLEDARRISWSNLGKRITFFLPGMFFQNGQSGKFPALSITGSRCDLMCDHCQGKLLESMIPVLGPEALVETCLALEQQGNCGVLISGGCNRDGCLPWEPFLPAIRAVKEKTRLFLSVHAGFISEKDATGLKQAGVDQAMVDVIGDDETLQRICHVPFGVERIEEGLKALQMAGLPIVPHIVCGIDFGRMRGEQKALDIVARFKVEQVVILSLMGIPGTPVQRATPPRAEDVAELIAITRLRMPRTPISLGCARPRGNDRLDVLAVDAGVNRMALPADEAIERAQAYGLDIRYRRTCCSVPSDRAG